MNLPFWEMQLPLWSAILLMLLSVVVVEMIRLLARFLKKRIDLKREYKMELVRKRLAAYEEIMRILGEQNVVMSQVDSDWEKYLKLNYERLLQNLRDSPKIELYCSDRVLKELNKINNWILNRINSPSNSNKRYEFAVLINGIFPILREEIQKGKIESDWGKKSKVWAGPFFIKLRRTASKSGSDRREKPDSTENIRPRP